MLIESMAGKSAAMNGVFQDSTPFQFHEDRRVIDHLGEQLKSNGFNYAGSEPLYNGQSGQVMQADIFVGLVFYQRLRHMVSDKSQARSTGPVMAMTRQPVKGRKKHGGIRLGEMERDALLSHGVSFCLQDRLMNCSDAHLAYVCSKCGGLLPVFAQTPSSSSVGGGGGAKSGFGVGAISFGSSSKALQQSGRNSFLGVKVQPQQTCFACKSSTDVRPVNLPYVFRYLSNELAGMGIKMSLTLSE